MTLHLGIEFKVLFEKKCSCLLFSVVGFVSEPEEDAGKHLCIRDTEREVSESTSQSISIFTQLFSNMQID